MLLAAIQYQHTALPTINNQNKNATALFLALVYMTASPALSLKRHHAVINKQSASARFNT